MEKNIIKLMNEFKRIKRMEYVKTVRNGSTGVGATFEYLLGKEEESFEIPDYYGIEIKTRRAYSSSPVGLFNGVPTGSTFYETKRLRDTYGYPDKNYKFLKRLNTEINGIELTKVGLWYYFKLRVDRKKEKIILDVYNYKKELIDSSTYWDFDILKEKLERKLSYLAIVSAWRKFIDGDEYFKYYKIEFYKLKSFDAFLYALEKGSVKVKLLIGNYYDAKRFGEVHSHGTNFDIDKDCVLDIFDKIIK